MRTVTLAVLLCLALAAPALAQPEPLLPSDLAPALAQPAAPVVVSAADLAALVKAAAALPAAPAAAPASVVTVDGVFGIGWGTIAHRVFALLAALFGAIKGGAYLTIWLRARRVLGHAIQASYWIAEKDFGDLPGAQKTIAALGALAKILGDSAVPLTLDLQAQATTQYKAMAASVPSVPPAALAQAQAAAGAAKDVATKTAAQIAAEASTP